MKITLKELKMAEIALNKVFSTSFTNVKLAYSIMKTSKKVRSELEIIEEMRRKLLDKYVDKDKEGKPIVKNDNFQITNQKDLDKEWFDFLNTEIELDVWFIPLEALEEVKLSILELTTIEKFIVEKSKETKND